MRERFDVASDLTKVANALSDSKVRQVALAAQLQEEEDYCGHLLSILSQRISAGFPGLSGEAALRKIEVNVRRSATRTIKNEKAKGSTWEAAKAEAETNAMALADKVGFERLTPRMSKDIDKTVATVYGLKKPLFAEKTLAPKNPAVLST